MRILVTGSRGQLGRELLGALGDDETTGVDLPQLNIHDNAATRRFIEKLHPDVVIHCAALTDTKLCEEQPRQAHEINALGTKHVAAACAKVGAAMLYVSTNEVFDGKKTSPYVESDATGPVNAYGRSKLAGEKHVRALVERHWVARTSWLYGESATNFPAKVLAAAERGGELSMVTDEVATPTWARDLAAAIARLIKNDTYGVFHLTNSGEVSRYDWAAEVLRLAGREGVALKPSTLAEFRPFPPKPPYTVLANVEAAKLGIELRPWQSALAEFFSTRTP